MPLYRKTQISDDPSQGIFIVIRLKMATSLLIAAQRSSLASVLHKEVAAVEVVEEEAAVGSGLGEATAAETEVDLTEDTIAIEASVAVSETIDDTRDDPLVHYLAFDWSFQVGRGYILEDAQRLEMMEHFLMHGASGFMLPCRIRLWGVGDDIIL